MALDGCNSILGVGAVDNAAIADVFEEMATVMQSLSKITWERLEREGSVTYP